MIIVNLLGFTVQNDTIVFGLEPFHCILLGKTMAESNVSGLAASMDDIETCFRKKKKFKKNCINFDSIGKYSIKREGIDCYSSTLISDVMY